MRTTTAATVVLLAVLVVINFMLAPDARKGVEVRTTLGVGPFGQAALVDLFDELGFSVDRLYDPPESWPADAVVWLIDPAPQATIRGEPEPVVDSLAAFVEGGGTAVLFGGDSEDWGELSLETEVLEDETELLLTSGPDPAAPARALRLEAPTVFTDAAGHDVLFSDGEGRPFVVVAPMGLGRVVAVADARFLSNRHIAEADSAVLALDLARRFGAPAIDERYHGLRITPGLWSLAGPGRIVLFVLCVGTLAVLAARWREPWLPRREPAAPAPEIALSTFVDALSGHYAKTRDHAESFRAYRDGLLHRVRRGRGSTDALGGQGFTRRLVRDPRLDDETRRWLFDDVLPQNRGEMIRAAQALERFAEERR